MSPRPELLAAALILIGAAALSLGRRVFAGGAARSQLVLLAGTPRGRLRAVPAAIKLLGLMLTALAVVLTPLDQLAWPAVMIVGLAMATGVPLRESLGRLADLLPFALLAGAGVLLAGDLERFAAVMARAVLVQLALVAVILSTGLPDLLAGLRALHLPTVLVEMCGVTLRYLALLLDEGSRMGQGFAARAVGRRDVRLVRPLGRVIGCLAARSLERAERVHGAMLARGYSGAMPILHDAPRPALGHLLALAGWAAWLSLPWWLA